MLTGSSTWIVWNRCPSAIGPLPRHRCAIVRVRVQVSIVWFEQNHAVAQNCMVRIVLCDRKFKSIKLKLHFDSECQWTYEIRVEYHHELPSFHRIRPICYWKYKKIEKKNSALVFHWSGMNSTSIWSQWYMIIGAAHFTALPFTQSRHGKQ